MQAQTEMRRSYDKTGLRLKANFEDTELWDTFYKCIEGSLQLWLKSKRKHKLKYDDHTRKADLRLNAVLRLNADFRLNLETHS